jgi:hypothetical protein
MMVRLGFSVAVHLDPDVLLIDEVLAVGDAGFRGKCYNKVDELRSDKAVLLVSHNMEHIGRVCDRVLVLDHGRAVYSGEPGLGIAAYRRASGSVEKGFVHCFKPIQSCAVRLVSTNVAFAELLEIDVDVFCLEPVTVQPRLVLRDARSAVIAEANSFVNNVGFCQLPAGGSTLHLQIASLPLQAGDYAASIVLHDHTGKLLLQGHDCLPLAVSGSGHGETAVQLALSVFLEKSTILEGPNDS